jgi:choline dehydrogenase
VRRAERFAGCQRRLAGVIPSSGRGSALERWRKASRHVLRGTYDRHSHVRKSQRSDDGRGWRCRPDRSSRAGRSTVIRVPYLYLSLMDRPNSTVLTDALVSRVTLDGSRATGVEIVHQGKTQRVGARSEVVLSLGAMHTPKVLMLSGIGDEAELRRFGIPVVQHLPGVGA